MAVERFVHAPGESRAYRERGWGDSPQANGAIIVTPGGRAPFLLLREKVSPQAPL
jgi:hypothetical protein